MQALFVLGKANTDMVALMLESHRVMPNGGVDIRLLEPALLSIFGDGMPLFLSTIRSRA